ncbi:MULTISPECIES: hypothetical protein [Ruminococcus]|uniref:Rhomboid family protein n=1 Tax=Ruminococcus flavefaciens TaxID=1265 RepID=A0A1M7G7V9_RUMFL|nr:MULTISPECIES: hypothetical protein [Ruminococcus]MCR4794530.1 hypothetical protein [Ruminococcus sp.]SHM12215.1 hypothetical protein SAMN04487860_101111 [Ruminococcus flavefaciens]
MLNQLLTKLERKCGKFAIQNLMLYIVTGMGVFFIANMVLTTNPDNKIFLYDMIYFDRAKIFAGQVWRVITFLFMPPDNRILLLLLMLFFYWYMGVRLEEKWGSFKFNVYYFTGVISCIIAGLITGYSTNQFLNLGVFLAFAVLFPDEDLFAFFVLPIKAKWIGVIDAAVLVYKYINGGYYIRMFIILSLVNFFIFFGKDFVQLIYYTGRRYYHKYLKK